MHPHLHPGAGVSADAGADGGVGGGPPSRVPGGMGEEDAPERQSSSGSLNAHLRPASPPRPMASWPLPPTAHSAERVPGWRPFDGGSGGGSDAVDAIPWVPHPAVIGGGGGGVDRQASVAAGGEGGLFAQAFHTAAGLTGGIFRSVVATFGGGGPHTLSPTHARGDGMMAPRDGAVSPMSDGERGMRAATGASAPLTPASSFRTMLRMPWPAVVGGGGGGGGGESAADEAGDELPHLAYAARPPALALNVARRPLPHATAMGVPADRWPGTQSAHPAPHVSETSTSRRGPMRGRAPAGPGIASLVPSVPHPAASHATASATTTAARSATATRPMPTITPGSMGNGAKDLMTLLLEGGDPGGRLSGSMGPRGGPGTGGNAGLTPHSPTSDLHSGRKVGSLPTGGGGKKGVSTSSSVVARKRRRNDTTQTGSGMSDAGTIEGEPAAGDVAVTGSGMAVSAEDDATEASSDGAMPLAATTTHVADHGPGPMATTGAAAAAWESATTTIQNVFKLLVAKLTPTSAEEASTPPVTTTTRSSLGSVPAVNGGDASDTASKHDPSNAWADGGGVGGGSGPAHTHGLPELQRQVEALSAENVALKAQMRSLFEAAMPDAAVRQRERTLQLAHILQLASTPGVSENDLRRAIMQYKDAYADFGRDRRAALQFHLRCLRALLMPNQITRMALWSLAQEDVGTVGLRVDDGGGLHPDGTTPPAEGEDASPLLAGSVDGVRLADVWNDMAMACGLTQEQQRRILALRDSVRERQKGFAAVLALMDSLDASVDTNFEALEFQMNLVMSHLTPHQVAAFLAWMESKQPTLHLFASLGGTLDAGGGTPVGRGPGKADAGTRHGAPPTPAAATSRSIHRALASSVAAASSGKGARRGGAVPPIHAAPAVPPPAPAPSYSMVDLETISATAAAVANAAATRARLAQASKRRRVSSSEVTETSTQYTGGSSSHTSSGRSVGASTPGSAFGAPRAPPYPVPNPPPPSFLESTLSSLRSLPVPGMSLFSSVSQKLPALPIPFRSSSGGGGVEGGGTTSFEPPSHTGPSSSPSWHDPTSDFLSPAMDASGEGMAGSGGEGGPGMHPARLPSPSAMAGMRGGDVDISGRRMDLEFDRPPSPFAVTAPAMSVGDAGMTAGAPTSAMVGGLWVAMTNRLRASSLQDPSLGGVDR